MMRIVCPVCGEEPKKGERHVCAAPPPTMQLVCCDEPLAAVQSADAPHIGMGVLQRRGLKATSTAVCGSITSLIQKSPNLWRSTGALARCGGENFVVGVLATAINSISWSKDPKGALVNALLGRVAHEAARSLQDCWRRRQKARAPKPLVKRDGYQQLALPAQAVMAYPGLNSGPLHRPPLRAAPTATDAATSSSGSARGRPPPLSTLPRNGVPDQVAYGTSVQSPSEKASTPRNKSNPRPNGARSVPMNPIQALKQRRAQQEQESEEKRMQQLLAAEEARAARRRLGLGSQPTTPQSNKSSTTCNAESIPSSADTEKLDCGRMLSHNQPSSPSTPNFIESRTDRFCLGSDALDSNAPASESSMAMDIALTPFERRAQRQAMSSPRHVGANIVNSSRPPIPANASGNLPGSSVLPLGEGETQSAPTTLEQWRPSGATEAVACVRPRASSSSSAHRPVPPSGEPSATVRLRERLKQRDGSTSGAREKSPGVIRDGSVDGKGWQARIEARQKEAEEVKEMETEHRQRTEERSTRRNDALRKVMERQAQRQQDVEGLEAS